MSDREAELTEEAYRLEETIDQDATGADFVNVILLIQESNCIDPCLGRRPAFRVNALQSLGK